MKKQTISTILVFLFSMLMSMNAYSQKQVWTWRDEVNLLKDISQLPKYRSHQLVEQISSYDRTGGNDDGFDGTYSYIRKEDGKLVIADLKGPGVVNRIWTPTPTDDLISFYFDGEEAPRLQIKFSDLFSGKVFPFVKPISGNEIGGYYCYVPIPYEKSLKIVFHGEKILFHQIQHRNMPGTKVKSWTGDFSPDDRALLDEVSQLWSNISPTARQFASGSSADVQVEEKVFTIQPGEEVPFFDMQRGGRIVGFDIDAGSAFEGKHKDIILAATWDNEKVEAVYSPVADFFGYAYGNAAMRSMLMGRYNSKNYCYLPMPFDKSANMKLIYKKRTDVAQSPISVNVKVYYNNTARDKQNEGKLYTVWRREKPETGKYYEFLDFKGKGHYVGTIHQAQGLQAGMTLFFEGDDITNIDGKMRLHGTGSEDYYNGGWYALLDRWDRGISLPIHGSLDYSLPMARTGGYRFFLADKMPFENEIYHAMEHGPEGNEFPVDYISVAFFYASNPLQARLDPSDALRVVYEPKEHVYFPALMDVTMGGGMQVLFDRGLRMITEHHHMARVMLNDVPEGRYKLAISYWVKPDGAEFAVWQRQNQLTDWRSTFAKQEGLAERMDMGEIVITKQTNSVTFQVRKQSERGNQFELDRIFLQRIDE